MTYTYRSGDFLRRMMFLAQLCGAAGVGMLAAFVLAATLNFIR